MLENILNEDASSFVSDANAPENGSSECAVTDYLGSLDPETRLLTNALKSADWIKVLLKLRDEPTLSIETVLKEVGKDVLDSMKAATEGKFDLVAAEEGMFDDGEGNGVTEIKSSRLSNKEMIKKISQCTPLRLEYGEREFLRLLESALYISDYTDQIDIYHSGNKNKEIVRQVRHICSILTGLVMARDYEMGQRLLKDHDFKCLEQFFCKCFEIGRRYKTLNPERMRDSYGKLMYMLMDTRKKHVRDILGFDCVVEIKTVGNFLRKRNATEILDDPLLITATTEIYGENMSASELNYMRRKKESATQELIAKYGKVREERNSGGFMTSLRFWSSPSPQPTSQEDRLKISFMEEEGEGLYEDEVELIIYSLKDHMTFMRYNVKPVEKMLEYLKHYFGNGETDLSIRYGVEGARLSHDHERQYGYVHQTLILWIEILRSFIELWMCSDQDLLDEKDDYRLCDTGQGLHRIKSCPRVRRKVNEILMKTAKGCNWIGSSVVHLGDHNVPNSLMFIDKYLQVPRIIQPIVSTIEHLDEFSNLITKQYQSVDQLKRIILQDFFRHGFDGSGADNFYDAGSCIDGRLTSAWNWCNSIEKKSYYPFFLLAGFQGFDGKF